MNPSNATPASGSNEMSDDDLTKRLDDMIKESDGLKEKFIMQQCLYQEIAFLIVLLIKFQLQCSKRNCWPEP